MSNASSAFTTYVVPLLVLGTQTVPVGNSADDAPVLGVGGLECVQVKSPGESCQADRSCVLFFANFVCPDYILDYPDPYTQGKSDWYIKSSTPGAFAIGFYDGMDVRCI